MIEVDITSNVEAQLRGVEQFYSRIDGVAAQALNTTAFEVRKQIVEMTYPRAFEVRNRALARRLWKVKLSNKRDLEAAVQQTLERAWTVAQAEGGPRPKTTGQIAIPVDPGSVRSPTGRVRKPLKPANITKRGKNTFLMGKGANKQRIVRRDKKTGDLTTIYIFKNSVTIPKRFMFYEDAEKRALHEFPRQFHRYMERLIIKSVFSAG